MADKISLEGLSLKKDDMRAKYEQMRDANRVLLPHRTAECFSITFVIYVSTESKSCQPDALRGCV